MKTITKHLYENSATKTDLTPEKVVQEMCRDFS